MAASRLLTATSARGVSDDQAAQLARLLKALAAEPSPPTTVTDVSEAANVHVADALSGLEVGSLLRSARAIADIGAGAGFPGLVLAVAIPAATVDLVESTARKCEVIGRLAASAGVANATAIARRAEEWGSGDGAARYDVVTVRALASLAVLVEYAAPLLRHGGHLIAWKGARDPAEEQAGAEGAKIVGLAPAAPLTVRPFQGSRERTLYVYEKVEDTPARFPRRPGMATKRPLA